jgi:hypothetical protein
MKKKHVIISFLAIASIILSGCDSVRDTFGLNHSAPNEWNTADPNPPLVIPPGLADRPKLPPPNPGAPNPNAVSPEKRAQNSVLGSTPTLDDGSIHSAPAKGEKDVVEKASETQEVTPNIRALVDEEAQADSTVSGKIISKIQTWKKEARENLSLSKPKADEEDSAEKQE